MKINKYSNSVSVVHQLLKILSIKHSITGLQRKIQEHPNYPSLLAIADCFTEWQVANEALNVDKAAYREIATPFIAHFNDHEGTFILVHKSNEGQITYSNEEKYKAFMSTKDFLLNWSGNILLAEANDESGEPEYLENKRNDISKIAKFPLLFIILIMGIILALDYTSLTIPYVLLLIVNLIGVGVTILLLIINIDTNNPLVQNLCSTANKNNCNAILKSGAAKLNNWLSWSEIGFFYFSGISLSLLMVPENLSLLMWLNVLVLPYVGYSIGYQYKHKTWCLLCCAVQIVLLLEFSIALWFSLLSLDLAVFKPTFSLVYILFSFASPVVFWYLLKPIFVQLVQFEPLKEQLKRFKYNGELFNQILRGQPNYLIGDDIMPITLGNPKAKIVITIVSNPFCGPCAKAHRTVHEWMQYRDDLQLKIIFSTRNSDDDQRTKIARHLITLNSLNDTKLLETALVDWYFDYYFQNTSKYDTWAKKYPVIFNGNINTVTEKHKIWCEMAQITFTPTIFVNGFKLPEPYRLEDIKYLIN